MHPAGENSAESWIQLHVQIMLRNILAAGSKIHSGVQQIELLIDRSADFLESTSSHPQASGWAHACKFRIQSPPPRQRRHRRAARVRGATHATPARLLQQLLRGSAVALLDAATARNNSSRKAGESEASVLAVCPEKRHASQQGERPQR